MTTSEYASNDQTDAVDTLNGVQGQALSASALNSVAVSCYLEL